MYIHRMKKMEYGFAKSPFGQCFVAANQEGQVYSLLFVDNDAESILLSHIEMWSDYTHTRNDLLAHQIVGHYISMVKGTSCEVTLNIVPVLELGTPFQLSVWKALLDIPIGITVTYSQVADMIGRPKSVRAVASAIGRNPISLLIPCHRVIRSDGSMGGYHWGLDRKRAILKFEHTAL